MAKKTTGIITPENAIRATKRRLPEVIKKLNAGIRKGRRSFGATESGLDFTRAMYPLILKAFQEMPGWIVETNENAGMITIRLPGEPIGYKR